MASLDCGKLKQAVPQNKKSDVNRRKDEFMAFLGHELRNPLSAIFGALQVLDQCEDIPPIAKDLHGVVRRQIQLMKTLVDELLDLSRIASGKIFLQKSRLNFGELARHTVEDYRLCLPANQVTLQLENSPTAIWVEGDAVRLSQVMTNLLQNATKFTDTGGTIVVSLRAQGAFAELSVRDSGIGMIPSEIAAVFELYGQSRSPRVRCQGGLGLGLSLSKRLIELHGGKIFAHSAGLGCGSTFTVRLPLSMEAPGEINTRVSSATIALLSHRVLVVDDRRDARYVLSKLLKGLGQEVQDAATGVSALEAVKASRPEIVFCDICLDDMDGYAVAAAIRSDPSLTGTYLVAVTASGGERDKIRAREAGFDCHLTKPINYHQLRDVIVNEGTWHSNQDELKLPSQ